MPDPNSALILGALETVVLILRGLHKWLDANRGEGGSLSAYGIGQQAEDLRNENRFFEACALEICELAPLVGPLFILQIRRNSQKIEAITWGGMGGATIQLLSLICVFKLAQRESWFESIDILHVNLMLANSLFTGLFLLAGVIGTIGLPLFLHATQGRTCKSTSCQYEKAARYGWALVGYGSIYVTSVAGSAGLVKHIGVYDIAFFLPNLILAFAIIWYGSRLLDRIETPVASSKHIA